VLGTLLTEWYLDIETEGTDPQQDRILTIQYQPLEDQRPTGAFQILTEWEWGEKQIVRFIVDKGLLEPTWDFVPVGNRLKFDITFIMEKAERYGLKKFTGEKLRYYWFSKPMLDLAPFLVMMNRGKFTGSSIAAFTEKPGSAWVPIWYREGEHAKIIEYVTREKDETLAVLAELKDLVGGYGDRRRKQAGQESED